jgi:hypothetical protein
MNIDELVSQFGSGKATTAGTPSNGLDVHGLAAEFGSPDKAKEVEKDYGNRLVVTRGKQVGEEGYQYSPVTYPSTDTGPQGISKTIHNIREGIENLPSNIGSSIVSDFSSGKQLATEGIGDVFNNKPASGIGKAVGGALMMASSPLSGVVKETVEKPVTEITGNPDIGSRAGIVASTALPVSKIAEGIKASIPANKAFKTLIDTIGPENVGNVAREMRANPRLTPADLSPATRQTAQKLFVTEGDKTKNYLAQSVEGRMQSAKSAVENAMTGAMGTTVNPVEKLAQLKQNIRDVGSKDIQPAIAGAKPVDLTDTISNIDSKLKPGVQSIISGGEFLPNDAIKKQLASVRRSLTNDKVVATDPQSLHKVQSVLRTTAEGLMQSASGADRQMGHAIAQVRNDIVNAIDKSSGGTYKPALAKYRDEYHIQDAFEHGHDSIISNSRKMTDRPEFFEQWVNNASPAEKEAAQEGARLAIDTQINGFKSAARRGTDVGQIDFNKDRITALFGKEKSDELFKKLEHERMIAETNSDLIKGSQTAMRLGADQRIALPTSSVKDAGMGLVPPALIEGASMMSGGQGGLGTAVYAGVKGAAYAKDKIAMALAKEHNANYAKLALPVEGSVDREALIKSLEAVANRQKPSLMQRANSIARLVGP